MHNKASWTITVLISIIYTIIIWMVTPYNDLVLNNPYISDSYLPVLGLFLIFILIIVINPLLVKFLPSFSLNYTQVVIITIITLVASVIPGQGFMRIFPHAIVKIPRVVRDNKMLYEIYSSMHLPQTLFPEKLEFGKPTPAADYFLFCLPYGEKLPYKNWIAPLLVWGSLMTFIWAFSIGLGLIIYPQWRKVERISFPLVTVYESIIKIKAYSSLPDLFRKRIFWLTGLTVILLHIMAGLKQYFPSAIPAIPLGFNIQYLFMEEPFVYTPWWIYNIRIFFTFIGISYFMPNRTSFSIWFFVIIYAIYEITGNAFFPPYYSGTVSCHRTGALIAMTLVILWLSRERIKILFKNSIKADTEYKKLDRLALLLFTGGVTGFCIWQIYIGVEWYWAIFYLLFGISSTLVITRLVAETGMPFLRIDIGSSFSPLLTLPAKWYGPVTLWFSQVILGIFTYCTRISAAVMSMHGFALIPDDKPEIRKKLVAGILTVMIAGLAIAGYFTLKVCYKYPSSLDGVNSPLSPGGTSFFDNLHDNLIRHSNILSKGGISPVLNLPYNYFLHTFIGFIIALVLTGTSLYFPRWPLHPIGLLLVGNIYTNLAWFSIFVGWLIKSLILKYGGSRLYEKIKPVFLGLIIGEMLAAVIWFIIPTLIVLTGHYTYHKILVVPQ